MIYNVYNEYIKSSCDIMLPIYHKLFNKIFDSGCYPSDWLSGEIIQLYKNKGDDTNPKNYRPITLLSCIGKLFTSILSDRLNKYSEEVNLILENQAGFRKKKNHGTVDHIFSLHTIIEIF